MELIVITSQKKFEQYRDDWSAILEENQNTNPFIEFDWINEWWKYLGRDKRVEIMIIRQGNQYVGFFPFILNKQIIGSTYTFMAFGQANYMDFVAHPSRLEELIKFVIDTIINKKKNVVFYLHGLLESSNSTTSLEKYLRDSKKKYSVHSVITPYIDLERIKLDEYMKKRKRLHRLERREKRLHENGEVKIRRSDPTEMDQVFKLHDKRWGNRRDTSGFTNEQDKKFYQSLVHIKSDTLKVGIDSLYINDTMIAFNYSFVCRGRFLGYVLGFDDDFEAFGPGRLLEKEMILHCKNEALSNFDLSIGYEAYKFDWNTDLDYTRKMIFSSNTFIAKAYRNYLTFKEQLIDRIKGNYKIVLFVRNRIGQLQYNLRKLIENKVDLRKSFTNFSKRFRDYIYENENYIIYKINKKDITAVLDPKEFVKLTLNDVVGNEDIINKYMKTICRKMYGGYTGYYPTGELTYENIIWTNDRVLKIDDISYLEQFRKGSTFLKNWNVNNLDEVCSLVKVINPAKVIYTAVSEDSEDEIALLERAGFSVNKKINKKTYLGKEKYYITE